MRKRKLWIALAAALLLAGFLVWFYTPREIRRTVPVCSLSGETAELELDVVWRRRLLRPDRLHGRVSLLGQTYYSREGYKRPDGTWKVFNDGAGFFEGIRQKFSGSRLWVFSPLSETGGAFPFQEDRTLVFSSISGESFRRFQLACSDIRNAEGNLTVFFGPADSAGKASAVWEAIQAD